MTLPARAHEIPSDVTVRAFVHPDANRLHLLVRVPLEAMRDYAFPTREPGGLLDLEAAGPMLRQAAVQWIGDYVRLYENGAELPRPELIAFRVSLPGDLSFASFDRAMTHVRAPTLTAETELPWRQAMLDLAFEFPIGSSSAQFAIAPGWAHLGVRTLTVLWFSPPTGAERAYEFTGDPGLIQLDPRWHQAALRFLNLGFGHILDGLDHLLFLFCLVLPVRRVRPLIAVITAFTVAHSITLAGTALGLAPAALWFPPLVETLIALSIVFMAVENVLGARLERRWILAFGFGLVHGFGFAFALGESLQFAGGQLLSALLAFNLGVELGQLLVVGLTVPLLVLTFRYLFPERVAAIVLSVLVGHEAWHWMTARLSDFRQYRFTWPAFEPADIAAILRGLMLLVIAGGVAWLLAQLYGKYMRMTPKGDSMQQKAGASLIALVALLVSPGVIDAQMTAPNPYQPVPGIWGQLPEGRTWGATSAIWPSPDGRRIWVGERCGANSCVGSTLDPVLLFDQDGRLHTSFGAGLIAWPHGLFVDHDGNVWVTDAVGYGPQPEGMGHVVYKFSPRGELLLTLGRRGVSGRGRDTFRKPSAVLVTPTGDIFVADGHDDDGNNRIVKLDADGRYLKEWGKTGSANGEFREPHALAMDSRGRLFVADRYNNRVQIFDQDGTHLASWTQFSRPSGLFIDGNDVLYATDSESNARRNPGWKRGIYIGSAETGWVTAFIPDPEPDQDNSSSSGAEGVAVDRDGNVYGAEVGPRMLRKYRRRTP